MATDMMLPSYDSLRHCLFSTLTGSRPKVVTTENRQTSIVSKRLGKARDGAWAFHLARFNPNLLKLFSGLRAARALQHFAVSRRVPGKISRAFPLGGHAQMKSKAPSVNQSPRFGKGYLHHAVSHWLPSCQVLPIL